MVSNGVTWENDSWTALPGVAVAGGQVCASQQVAAEGVLFTICNGPQSASVSYTRFAGDGFELVRLEQPPGPDGLPRWRAEFRRNPH